MTVDEYLRTPVTLKPMELIYGSLKVAESPSVRHQSAVAELFVALRWHVRARNLGQVWLSPLDVVLDRERAVVMQPDLFFIAKDRSWIVHDRIYGAPDLCVEVLSPQPRIGSTEERVQLFADHGVRECWLLHQDRQEIIVIRNEKRRIAGQMIFDRKSPVRSAVLPDFAMTWETIFPDA